MSRTTAWRLPRPTPSTYRRTGTTRCHGRTSTARSSRQARCTRQHRQVHHSAVPRVPRQCRPVAHSLSRLVGLPGVVLPPARPPNAWPSQSGSTRTGRVAVDTQYRTNLARGLCRGASHTPPAQPSDGFRRSRRNRGDRHPVRRGSGGLTASKIVKHVHQSSRGLGSCQHVLANDAGRVHFHVTRRSTRRSS